MSESQFQKINAELTTLKEEASALRNAESVDKVCLFFKLRCPLYWCYYACGWLICVWLCFSSSFSRVCSPVSIVCLDLFIFVFVKIFWSPGSIGRVSFVIYFNMLTNLSLSLSLSLLCDSLFFVFRKVREVSLAHGCLLLERSAQMRLLIFLLGEGHSWVDDYVCWCYLLLLLFFIYTIYLCNFLSLFQVMGDLKIQMSKPDPLLDPENIWIKPLDGPGCCVIA